jgi:hypothetical protein
MRLLGITALRRCSAFMTQCPRLWKPLTTGQVTSPATTVRHHYHVPIWTLVKAYCGFKSRPWASTSWG